MVPFLEARYQRCRIPETDLPLSSTSENLIKKSLHELFRILEDLNILIESTSSRVGDANEFNQSGSRRVNDLIEKIQLDIGVYTELLKENQGDRDGG